MTITRLPTPKLVRLGAVAAFLLLAAAGGAVALVLLRPWENALSPDSEVINRLEDRNTTEQNQWPFAGQSHVTVSTRYGDIRGLTYKVSEEENIDVFFGVPFAQPPVGELRFARPEPVSAWRPAVKDATRYGHMCVQQLTWEYNLTTASEDCLYLNIYSPRHTSPQSEQDSNSPLPVMLYVHPGSFRDGSSIYFNYTNLALKGVVVVTTNYRLDGFGFLSTQDDVIPGNFALLDAALALEFVKEVITSFRGDPHDITMFGASAGSALVTQMALSPLTRGKFQRAILQSGPGTCNWASYKPGTPFVPRQVALDLGRRLNCKLPQAASGRNQSLALLGCLRNQTTKNLLAKIRNVTVDDYNSSLIFVPVSGDAFGVLPEPPSKLASNYSSMAPIPTIFGWSSNDSSWTVEDPHNKGENYTALVAFLKYFIYNVYPPQHHEPMFRKALELYNLTDPSKLSPYDVRSADVRFRTDVFMESFIVKEARQFAKAAGGRDREINTFVYQYDHRPSYKTNPLWQGVTHMDERGMVMGLPNGPNPLTYPRTSYDDRVVGELMTTLWSNFAKYGHPTPEPLPNGVKWPKFGHTSSDQNLLLIRPRPEVRRFDREEPVVLWTGSSGLDGLTSVLNETDAGL